MPSAKRIICVGHAALDRIYRIEAFPPEPTKVRALEHVEAGGGMAANAAVTIARLGGKAELWSRTGDDAAGSADAFGQRLERLALRGRRRFLGAARHGRLVGATGLVVLPELREFRRELVHPCSSAVGHAKPTYPDFI